jgi:hypothetical protein
MKVIVLYRPNSEHSRQVEEFVHDFIRYEPDRKVDLIDVDSPYGVSQCQLYDIMSYPAIIAKAEDGTLLRSWAGELPMMDELSYYAQPV